MALFEKLVGLEENGPAIHSFSGALQEWQDGETTRADIVASYGLSADDDEFLDFVRDEFLKADTALKKLRFRMVFEDALILGYEKRLGYDVEVNFKARIAGLA